MKLCFRSWSSINRYSFRTYFRLEWIWFKLATYRFVVEFVRSWRSQKESSTRLTNLWNYTDETNFVSFHTWKKLDDINLWSIAGGRGEDKGETSFSQSKASMCSWSGGNRSWPQTWKSGQMDCFSFQSLPDSSWYIIQTTSWNYSNPCLGQKIRVTDTSAIWI